MGNTRKTRPTPARPRAARPAAAPAQPEPVEYDGQQVVFSFTRHLTERGLLEHKPVEVGGRIFNFRAVGTTVENTQLVGFMIAGKYREAIELMLADPTEIDDVIALFPVPYATEQEQDLWRAFTEAISGVSLGESSAS